MPLVCQHFSDDFHAVVQREELDLARAVKNEVGAICKAHAWTSAAESSTVGVPTRTCDVRRIQLRTHLAGKAESARL